MLFGDQERLLSLGERLIASLRDSPGRQRHALGTARAVLAEARGELAAAGDLYAQAARGWKDYGAVLERAYALLGVARCREGDGGADGALDEAQAAFAAIGATPLVATR